MFEAILIDLLLENKIPGLDSRLAPKEKDLNRWGLFSLIDVAVELKLVSGGIRKLSHQLREYRNLVHPGNEIRSQLRFNAEEAKIAVAITDMLWRDLTIGIPI